MSGRPSHPSEQGESKLSARELNEQILYAQWSVFRSVRPLADTDRAAAAAELEGLLEAAGEKDVYTRGCYDVAGLRADADVMFWWTCPELERIQELYTRLRQSAVGSHLEPVWSGVGLHRPAEFNRSHIPAYVRREDPKRWVCVYPFVRSLEWYLLPDDERRAMLAEHGIMGREFPDVRANTVAAFGLGDYEWMLAFEADELPRIVDCIRHLRGSKARLHTKVEIPFYTGVRKEPAEIVASLP